MHRILLAVLLLAACGSGTTSPPDDGNTPAPVATITLSPPAVTVPVGGTQTLTATLQSSAGVTLGGRTVTWTSSNLTVATVAAGLVTGVSAGTATITASSEGKSQTALATVTAGSAGSATFSTIAPGGLHTCALTPAGKPYCWGANNLSQIGLGTIANTYSTPQVVAGNLTFTALSAGMYHTCGVTAAGAAWCWGWNIKGQLGDGTQVDKSAPALVSGSAVFSKITAAGQAGGEHTCALTVAGAAWCWGWNLRGQLGDGTTVDRLVPVAVQGGLTFVSLSAGDLHTCGLTAAGKVYCWGDANEIGEGASVNRSVPTLIAGNLTFKSLSATWWSACAITTADATYCWGLVSTSSYIKLPVLIPGFTFSNLAPSNQFTCGVITTGAGYCWGLNNAGQLGDGTSANRATPVPVSGSVVFASIATGNGHSCGLTVAGAAYCWGLNSSGQVGDQTKITKLVPVAVVSP